MDTIKIENLLNNEFNFWSDKIDDIGDRIGLIMMVCYLKHVLQAKKPNITHADVIKLCIKDTLINPESGMKLALFCDWFAKDCKKFQDLGVKPKDMPSLIRKQLSELCIY